MRMACLRVPDFPLQALRRTEPDLAETPLAVACGHQPRDLLVAVSAEAAGLGVRPGMTAAQARQVAPTVVVRVTPRIVAEAAEEALADVATSFSPRTKLLRTGEVLVDVGGLLARHGTEDRLAHDLLRACHRIGLDACVGIASSAGVARVAARTAPVSNPLNVESARSKPGPKAVSRAENVPLSRSTGRMDYQDERDEGAAICGPRTSTDRTGGGTFRAADPAVVIVPAGAEREFLAPLPVALIEPSPEMSARLVCWGIHRVGEMARLPRREIAVRLADEGVELHRLACGEEERAFVPDRRREALKEGAVFEAAIGGLDAFLFMLRALLSRLDSRLGLRGEGFAEVLLELALEGGERCDVRVRLVAPACEVSAVLALVRLQLEAAPPGAPVEGVTVIVTPGAVQMTQGTLFGPRLPAPGKLAGTLARLAAMVGPDRVGAPAVPDTHRPGAGEILPFTLAPAGGGDRQAKGRRRGQRQGVVSPHAPAAHPARRTAASSAASRPAVDFSSPSRRQTRGVQPRLVATRAAEDATAAEGARLRDAGERSAILEPRSSTGAVAEAPPAGSGWVSDGRLVLRAVRPPRAAEVVAAGGRPLTVRTGGIGGAVVGYAGPYRVIGEWWGDEPFARDDFDVATSDGALFRVYFDRVAKRWYVDGIYD